MKRLLFVLALILSLAANVRAAIIYVECSITDTGGTGASGDPYHALDDALDNAAPGDIIYVSGICREQVLTIADANVTIRTTPGDTNNALITGGSSTIGDSGVTTGVVLWKGLSPTWQATSWTDVGAATDGAGGRYWSATINNLSAVSIASVTIGWEANVDIYGRRYGHLRSTPTSAATVASTEGSYWIDTSGTPDIIYVNPYGAVTDMSAKRVRLCRNDEGMNATGIDGITIDRVDFGPHCENSSTNNAGSASWNLIFVGGSNITVENCNFWDCGRHAVGWTNATSNQTIQNCVVRNCWAGGARYSDNTLYVVQTGSGGTIRDVLFDQCTASCYGRLDEAGTDLDSIAAYVGFYAHGAADVIKGLTFTRCYVQGFSDTDINVQGWGIEDTTNAANYRNFDTYPVKLIECKALGIEAAVTSSRSIAMKRCWFNTEDYAATANAGMNSYTTSCLWPNGTNARMYAESCVFVTNTGQASGDERAINWEGQLCLLNNVFIDYNTLTNPAARYDVFIREGTNEDELYVVQNIFARYLKSTGLAVTTAAGLLLTYDADVTFASNCWIGMSVPGMPAAAGGSAAIDTWVEWFAIETAAASDQYATASVGLQLKYPLFSTLTGEMVPGTLMSRYRSIRSTFLPEYGINENEYNGQWGPFQFGDQLEFGGGDTTIRNRSRP